MTTISRIRVTLTGSAVIGPSVMTLYTDAGVGTVRSALQTLLQDIKAGLPPNVTYTIPNTGEDIDDTTGTITGSWTAGSVTTTTGTSGAGYTEGVGVRFVWNTGALVAGRRVRGTSFIVPASKDLFSGTRAIDDTIRATWQGYINTFVTATGGSLLVWSRPTDTRAGSSHPVTSGLMPDAVSWLRTRRT